MFASSVFVPVATFPGWLQAFAEVSPVTLTADTARSLTLTGTPAWLAPTAAWTVGLLAVFVPLCVWRYRRMRRPRAMAQPSTAKLRAGEGLQEDTSYYRGFALTS